MNRPRAEADRPSTPAEADEVALCERTRADIDRLDRALVDLLARRAALVAAAARHGTGDAVDRALGRPSQMVEARRVWARDGALDPDFVEALFWLVIGHCMADGSRGVGAANRPRSRVETAEPETPAAGSRSGQGRRRARSLPLWRPR